MSTTFSPLQLIKRTTDQKVVESLSGLDSIKKLFDFLVPSVEFLTLALAGYLLYWLVSWLFSRFEKWANLLPSGRTLQMKIFSFLFVLFSFYTQEIYGNLLSTESVVVRTDDLLYTKEQILKTNKEFCFWESGSEMDILVNVSCRI